jgi:hypothetical protein
LFRRFRAAVATETLRDWLPRDPATILDLSPSGLGLQVLMVTAGHNVVHAGVGGFRPEIAAGPGRVLPVHADGRLPHWLASHSVDAVVAEGGALSDALATEVTLVELRRVMRRGGRLLLAVDSLVTGLSELADQARWAELADVPAADVVLVPRADGTMSRCFWPEELESMLEDSGFSVDWVRPRTVLSERAVVHALGSDPSQLASLVATERRLAVRRQRESIGAELVASATAA